MEKYQSKHTKNKTRKEGRMEESKENKKVRNKEMNKKVNLNNTSRIGATQHFTKGCIHSDLREPNASASVSVLFGFATICAS